MRVDGVIEGVVTEGNVRCDECGGTLPVKSEVWVLVDLRINKAKTNCGSCYRDED